MFVSPTVAGNAVLIGSCAGTLYALDRAEGTPLWSYDTRADGAAAQFHGEPLLLGKRAIIPTDADPKGHLYAFDTASGVLQWKLAFDGGVATTPMLVDGRVIVVAKTGDVVAVEPDRGAILWRQRLGDVSTWSPAAAGKRVFVAEKTNDVVALDAATGAVLWRAPVGARPNTALVVIGKTLVVGTQDGDLHWLALDSGAAKKRVALGAMPYGTPIYASPLLYVLTANGTLLALDAESGAVRWKQETPREWTTYRPLVTGATIVAGTEEKTLCAFDRTSGESRWCRDVGQVPRGLGAGGDGTLYVGSLSGVVQAFRFDAAHELTGTAPR
ncbi:MAG TPA: PQQ-binding-like beta-propeller repeat protein [Thermoanaerobaculia bacterium]